MFTEKRMKAGYSDYLIELSRSDSGALVQGQADWDSKAILPATTVRVKDVKADKKKGILRITLDRKIGDDVEARIPVADSAFLVNSIFAPAHDSQVVRDSSFSAVGARVFQGAFAAVDGPPRRRILEIAEASVHRDSLTVKRLQGRPYLLLRAPPSAVVYNANQTSEAERFAGALNDVAFPILRTIGQADSVAGDGYGYAIEVMVPSKPFAERYAGTSYDHLVLYVQAKVARQFAEAELTTQDLIDASIVIANQNRIKVDLTR